jgi:hypothetical protein
MLPTKTGFGRRQAWAWATRISIRPGASQRRVTQGTGGRVGPDLAVLCHDDWLALAYDPMASRLSHSD